MTERFGILRRASAEAVRAARGDARALAYSLMDRELLREGIPPGRIAGARRTERWLRHPREDEGTDLVETDARDPFAVYVEFRYDGTWDPSERVYGALNRADSTQRTGSAT